MPVESKLVIKKKKKLHVVERKKLLPYTKPNKSELSKFLLIGLCIFVLGLILLFVFGTVENEFIIAGEKASFGFESLEWAFWIIGAVIAFNAFWLRFDFAQPFGWKYGISMLKTKRFVETIKSLSRIAWWFDKVCIFGMFLGFGISGIDYWYYTRKPENKRMSKRKREALLFFSIIILGLFFHFLLGILFSVPLLEPLYWPCLIGFVLLGFGGMSLVMLLGYGFLAVGGLFIAKQLCPAVAPVIPGAPIPGMGTPIPLIAWISLVAVLVVHEFSHGIMMTHFKEKIKSVGVLLAGFIPIGAFVEQDDKTFNTLNDDKALLVLSAGSASNIFTIPVIFIIMLLFEFIVSPIMPAITNDFYKAYGTVRISKVEDKVSFCGVDSNAPAKGKLFVGDVIKQINGVDINSIAVISTEFRKSKGDINFVIERINLDTNNPEDLNLSITPFKFVDLGTKQIGVEFEAVKTGYQQNWLLEAAGILISNIEVILIFILLIS
ncbi:MAG: site-2 protease family protein, partial [Candidatus Diapherotrites archaeon]|nr:site-2 protease family protein [Candidatus Diapherotrites archaeon]